MYIDNIEESSIPIWTTDEPKRITMSQFDDIEGNEGSSTEATTTEGGASPSVVPSEVRQQPQNSSESAKTEHKKAH